MDGEQRCHQGYIKTHKYVLLMTMFQDFFSSSLHGVMDAIREVNCQIFVRLTSFINFVSNEFVAAKFRSEATPCCRESGNRETS